MLYSTNITTFYFVQELNYLQALLATKRRGQENIAALLDDAIDIHLASLHKIPLGFQYFEMLNADFLLAMAKVYIALLPAQVSFHFAIILAFFNFSKV